jgi:hypothetical protein
MKPTIALWVVMSFVGCAVTHDDALELTYYYLQY